MKNAFLGLALGGGGARGAAHVGVLKVLEKNKIIPEVISGTSIGAIIGAMFAFKPDADWISHKLQEFLMNPDTLFHSSLQMMNNRNFETLLENSTKKIDNKFAVVIGQNRSQIVKRDVIDEMIEFLIPVKRFEELNIRLKVVASDIQTGNEESYETGDLVEAISRSCSIPGYVKPTKDGDSIIVDGGVTSPIPIDTIRDECEFLIAINIDRGKLPKLKNPNMLEIIKRSDLISNRRLAELNLKNADYVISPDVLGLHWSEYNQFSLLVENGIKATEKEITMLNEKIRRESNLFHKMEKIFTLSS